MPSTSRCPSSLTPTATSAATFAMRPPSRLLKTSASNHTYGKRPSSFLSRKAFTDASSSFVSCDTWLFDIFSMPNDCTRSSTRLVDTPWTYASTTTLVSAFSARRRGSSSHVGKYVPCLSFGIDSAMVPARVSHGLSR